MIEAIIFDMDGTLVDTEPFNTEIERRQFEQNNLTISEEEHKKYLGTASEAMWREIVERYSLSKPVNQLVEENHAECVAYFSELKEIPVMPGVIDLLEKLQLRGVPTAVASSSTPEMIDLILSRTHLKKYFKVIVSTQEVGKSKPAPDVFLKTAQKLGIDPSKCLVVEDSKNGIAAAQSAGMACIAFQSENSDPANHKEADAVIRNFKQLETLF
jgi:haloacid dehalogenase superfamily, subfamily IA, variant 3 with third motif having DD or ED/haloacid dehalogenase superfamily, subfamily IA, variant 1 with third motif having Dx(3-4)D or Dx(3-4)E